MGRSESLRQAQRRYNQTHKELRRHVAYKSYSKNFVLKYATDDELIWLRNLIDQKLKTK